MEEALVQHVREIRSKGIAIHQNAIRDKARELIKDVYPEVQDFKASSGWCYRFMKRNNLVERRVTSVGQKVPENAKELADEHLAIIHRQLADIPDSSIVANMDKTPLSFDIPSSSTIDFKGVKTVTSKTTGHEKLRFTAVITVLSNGQYLPTMVIFRGLKHPPKGSFPPDVIVEASKGGVMTQEFMTNIYIPKVIKFLTFND